MSTGDKLGGAIKGAFDAIHGAGESIRGNINHTLDSAGEGLRSADPDQDQGSAAAHGKSHDYQQHANQKDVAAKGESEFQHGVGKLGEAFHSDKPSN